jgi:hydroxymethylglutaryl-CoA reductase
MANMSELDPSRIPEFYKYSLEDRLRILRDRELLDDDDYALLRSGRQALAPKGADRMVENVIGVLGLPIGLGLNFRINGRPYVVPVVVEEPSIIAALSNAAKVAGEAGGFEAESSEPVLAGQIQLMGVDCTARAKTALLQAKEEILNLANSLQPRLVARGGGARDIEVHIHSATSVGDMVVLHILVDTRDAMGANLVNSMCEGVAPLTEKLTGGKVFLRILSNLCDRSLVRARVVIPPNLLAGKGYAGEDVCEGIVLAGEFARVDPYRATTHNKGIMNGIDAVALATGNDWRAIEAAAHAYAARGSAYTSLTSWQRNEAGDLVGSIEVPIKVGTVGGPLQSNPAVGVNLRMLAVKSARELAEVMGTVGLAQNFSALRALVTQGIQQGHMTLHARSVAMAAGAPPEIFDRVVEELVDSGEIKVWKAERIVSDLASELGLDAFADTGEGLESTGTGAGKVILLGEHSVVYGRHAVAAPIPLAIRARVEEIDEGVHLIIPAWGVEERMHLGRARKDSMQESLDVIFERLDLGRPNVSIKVFPSIPRAMGMGGSAAIAVAVIRAIGNHFKLDLSDDCVNAIAFECEKIAHGTASGIDNTLATYGRFILFRKGEPAFRRPLSVPEPIPVVLGITGVESLTAKMVARVRAAWQRNETLYEHIFSEIDQLTMQGVEAIESNDLETLGELMNINQGLLNALQVSSPELEELIQVARDHGAIGAKLTGGGGGGTMVALCPDKPEKVATAMQQAGYQAIVARIGGAAEIG